MEVPELADLISHVKTTRGWSYQTLADRTEGVLTRQRWQQLGTTVRIKEFPEPETLSAIADALQVNITSVVLAAAKTIGLPVTRELSALATLLPVGTERLADYQRDAIVGVIKAMLRSDEDRRRREDTSTAQGSPQGRGKGSLRSVDGRAPIKPVDTSSTTDSDLSDTPDKMNQNEPLGAVAYMGEGATDAERARVTEIARKAREAYDAKHKRDTEGQI